MTGTVELTDGGGWTLGVTIASELGPIDLFRYRSPPSSAHPLNANYGLDLGRMQLSTSTEYRLGCVETSDLSSRKMFVKGLDPAAPIFKAAGTIPKAGVTCSKYAEFSGPLFGTDCFTSPWGMLDNDGHTYYGNTAWDITWALFSGGSAYTLRHCAARGPGYHNRGTLWFR